MDKAEKAIKYPFFDRLQNNDYKLWTFDEIMKEELTNNEKKVAKYIALQNFHNRLPSIPKIFKNFGLNSGGDGYGTINSLEKKEIVIKFTIPELVEFYNIGRNPGKFFFPENLEWIKMYTKKMRGGKGSASCWNKKFKNSRARRINNNTILSVN